MEVGWRVFGTTCKLVLTTELSRLEVEVEVQAEACQTRSPLRPDIMSSHSFDKI